jgi:hypothetical protein
MTPLVSSYCQVAVDEDRLPIPLPFGLQLTWLSRVAA